MPSEGAMAWKHGTPDGARGGHRRYRLTGPVRWRGVVVERKVRELLRAKQERRRKDEDR